MYEHIPKQPMEYEIIIDELYRRVFIDGTRLIGTWYPAEITQNSVQWTFDLDFSKSSGIPNSQNVYTINRVTGKYTGTKQILPGGEVEIIEKGECRLVQRRF